MKIYERIDTAIMNHIIKYHSDDIEILISENSMIKIISDIFKTTTLISNIKSVDYKYKGYKFIISNHLKDNEVKIIAI